LNNRKRLTDRPKDGFGGIEPPPAVALSFLGLKARGLSRILINSVGVIALARAATWMAELNSVGVPAAAAVKNSWIARSVSRSSAISNFRVVTLARWGS
jgi:hypothetical protein